ncbi:hypothetical protein BCEP4_180014 [Burkholderia cepacia]|nr:hypothetical protein BCEP4_180014 [Burkholderia cepacia]
MSQIERKISYLASLKEYILVWLDILEICQRSP